MKKTKLIFAIMVSLGILMFIAPKTEVNAASKMTLSQLKAKFPHGKYWNHIGSKKNNPNGWTNKPCTHHGVKGSGCSYDGSCGCNATSSSHQAIQCAGYAYKVGLDAFGTDPKTWKTYTGSSAKNYLYNNLKAGDLIRYKNDGHSIYVTAVSGNTVTYTHCNVDGRCKIEWGRTISKSKIAATLTSIRVAPSTFSKYAMDIVYDNNGGEGSVSKQMVAYESSFTIPSASNLHKAGYTFDGFYLYRNQDQMYMCEDGNWYSETDILEKNLVKKVYQQKNTLNVSKTWTSDPANQTKFIFKAKWKENNYTLEFDANEGEGRMPSINGVYNTDLVLPQSGFFKEDYTFDGYYLYSVTKNKWLYNNNGIYVWLSEDNASQYEKVVYQSESVLQGIYPTKDEVLVAYAKWKPETMTIRYSCIGHDSVLEDTIVSFGETSKLSKNTCMKKGYTFKGWYAYSTMLSKKLYTYNGEVIWSDERNLLQGYVPVLFKDESEVSFISPIAHDVVVMQSVWEKTATGEIVIDDYHTEFITKTMTKSLMTSNISLIQGIVDIVSGLLELVIF